MHLMRVAHGPADRVLRWLLCLTLMLASVAGLAAERIGEAIFVQSVASAQQPGQTPRFLEKGSPIEEGDVISTGAKGFALIGFKDGTQTTLAPNTTFTVERLRHGAGEESAVFRVVKGGVRALTGLIAQRNPPGVNVNMGTATIGIRGTEFDARLCQNDCTEDEARAQRQPGAVPADAVVARVAVVAGTATATSTAKGASSRPLEKGSALFSGDTVRTQAGSYAVLAFRDQTKVTVVANSVFRLEDVRFAGANADTGNFAVRLLQGGVRAITGALARRDLKAVSFGTSTATIGIRGTGIDLAELPFCFSPQDCAAGVQVFVWEGGPVEIRGGDRSLLVRNGETGAFVLSRNFLELAGQLQLPEPRPDGVDVPWDELFGKDLVGAGPYVAVTDGRVLFCAINGQCTEAAPGDAYQVRPGSDRPTRIQFPTGMRDIPSPSGFNAGSFRILERLNPGDLICEF